MADVIETTEKSWFTSIIESIKGVLSGLGLILLAFGLLFYNEGNAVRVAKGLSEVKGQIVQAEASKVDGKNDGKLIHLQGTPSSKEGLVDSLTQASVPGAIRLERKVEMYQWVEKENTRTEKKAGGKEVTIKEYTYLQEWSSEEVSTANFKKRVKDGQEMYNPSMPYEGQVLTADEVLLGKFNLSSALVEKLTESSPVELTEAAFEGLDYEDFGVHLRNNVIYIGKNPDSPLVGDVRISLKAVRPYAVSVVARQEGSTLVPWVTPQDTTIALLEAGKKTPADMIATAEANNTTMTWVMRLLGIVLMAFGFSLVFKPLAVVADVVPFIGSIVEMGTGMVSFALALPLSLLTIGFSWLFFRPLAGTALLVLGTGVFVGIFFLSRKRRARRNAEPLTQPEFVGG